MLIETPLPDGKIFRHNFLNRWAATASCEFAYVTGSVKGLPNEYDFRAPFTSGDSKLKPPVVTYRKEAFGHNDWAGFDIRREVPKQRCYFCHSNVDVRDGKTEKWNRMRTFILHRDWLAWIVIATALNII